MGVDTETFHPAKRDPALREQLALATETRLLVYAGRFAPEKNLDVLAAAVKRLGRPYHLLLVGGEKPERRANHVTILPYEADSSRVAALLASADAFVHAGDQETFGLVALEAMACGLPAVVVKGGALPELIDDSAGVTAERTTAADMADAIAALFTRDLQHVGIAARQRVLARYSWNSAFTQLTRHYAHLLDRPSLVYGALSHASG
jgi:alpha-1,6-mannosyltransferase